MKHKHLLKKLLATTMAATMVVMPCNVWATEAYDETSEVQEEVSTEEVTTEEPSLESDEPEEVTSTEEATDETMNSSDKPNYAMGHREDNGRIIKSVQDGTHKMQYSKEALASSYLTPNLPAVRDQNPYGTCWSFAATACMEINMMKKGYGAKDFSELHLVYFAYNSALDPLGGMTDTISYTGSDGILDCGGNDYFSVNALAAWRGSAAESVAPYGTAYNIDYGGTLPNSVAYSSEAHLQNYYFINKSDVLDIKQAVVDYGAVSFAYCHNDSYYNSSTYGYYNNYNTYSNHAVTLVGWNDNYSASNFVNRPEGDGAWIIRNSWGSNWGDGGYFYISYYDTSIQDVTVYDAEPATNYDNNYQYDGTTYSAAYYSDNGTEKAANVFTAKANNGGQESLDAVSFELMSVNADYRIDIYKNLTNLNNPESGVHCATQYGSTTYEGRYTVELNNPITLNAGDTYSVVVYAEVAPSEDPFISIDYEFSTYYGDSQVTNAGEKQSFRYVGGSWVDIGKSEGYNYRIKAYTNNVVDYNGLIQASDGNWYYYIDGEVDWNYTGFASNAYGVWYVHNGKVEFVTGIVEIDDVYYYVEGGSWNSERNDVLCYNGDWYHIQYGTWDPEFEGIALNQYGLWYIVDGKVAFDCTGLTEIDGMLLYINSGLFDVNYTSLYYYEGEWIYINEGVWDYNYNGVVYYYGDWYYVEDGVLDWNYTGFASNDYGVWYIVNGKVAFNYTGIVEYESNFWVYVNGGAWDATYTSLYYYKDQWIYVYEGIVDFCCDDVVCYYGDWYYVEDSILDWGYTGIGSNAYGDWYIVNGKVAFDYTGLIDCDGYLYYINGGAIDYTYSNLYYYEGEWLYVYEGYVDYNYSDVVYYYGDWYCVINGVLDWSYTGLAENYYGVWYVVEGKVALNHTGMIEYEGDWYYIKTGAWAYDYVGLVQNGTELWYIDGGVFDDTYNGTLEIGGITYVIEDGIVIEIG